MPQNNKRREASKRQLQQRLVQRQQRAAARRRTQLIASVSGTAMVLVLVIVLIAVLGGGKDKKTPAAAPTSPTTSATPTATLPAGQCDWPTSGQGSDKANKLPKTTVPTTGKVTVNLTTTRGPMTFTLDRALAPCTVANFVSLAQQGYYDATSCHRLVTSGIFVLQCGDPLGNGTGGPGYTIKDEATGAEEYPAGTIAMARTDAPHSGGSQFFIVYKDSPHLKQGRGALQYTVFGTVTKGISVVKTVAAGGAATGTDGPPKLAIKLTKVKVS